MKKLIFLELGFLVSLLGEIVETAQALPVVYDFTASNFTTDYGNPVPDPSISGNERPTRFPG